MRTRVLLTVLILTNPICCQMFGSVETVRPEEPVADCGGCACECSEREQPDSSSDRGNVPHAPCECPNCELCQCICAGAVVEDVVTVDDSDGAAPIVAILGRGTEGDSLLSPQLCSCSVQMVRSDATGGRAARILHCSLLC